MHEGAGRFCNLSMQQGELESIQEYTMQRPMRSCLDSQREIHGLSVPHQLRCRAVRYRRDETRLSDYEAHVNDV